MPRAFIRPDWHDRAECRPKVVDGELVYSTHLFYPAISGSSLEGARRKREAAALCAVCPVARECLDTAMEPQPDNEHWGIWAGTTHRQRLALRTREQETGS